MKTLTCLIVIAAMTCLAAPGWSRDLKTQSGETYANIVVKKKEPMGLHISHDSGVAFIDFRNLSEAVQTEFGYDPATYAAALEKKIAAQKLRREQMLAARKAAAQRAAARQAAAASSPQPEPAPSQPAPAFTPQRGIEAGVESPGFKYGRYQYDGWSITNGVPNQTGPNVPYVPWQGGYVTPPYIRQR